MAHKDSPKTEQDRRLLTALLQSGPSATQNSFMVTLDRTTCEQCRAGKAEILQLFSAERAVRHAGFTMRYDADRDCVYVDKITQSDAAAAPAAAKQEWANDPNLQREFGSEAAYLAYRKAELSGRARIFGRPKAENRP
jgi:hypothetical protein